MVAVSGEPGVPCSPDKCFVVFDLNSDLITNSYKNVSFQFSFKNHYGKRSWKQTSVVLCRNRDLQIVLSTLNTVH